jgi:anaphase-promoting complex subunit 8
MLSIRLVRPIQDYAKSSMAVAEYQLQIPDGDLLLAREYLERVAGSNAEEAGQAGELVKVVKLAMEEKKTGETAG